MSDHECPELSPAALEQRGDCLVGIEFTSKRPPWVGGDISSYDTRFLAGLVNSLRPRRIVEVGVASGWSSAVLLKSISEFGDHCQVVGIDLSPTYYLDAAIPTGQATSELVPDLMGRYQLLTGKLCFEAMPEVERVDFAFVDAHHLHPWATLDVLGILPHIERGSWIALHDLNLCRFERHKHTNRGPFYLYYMWPNPKIHSTQQPTMIGAIQLGSSSEEDLSNLLEVLYTPWEMRVSNATLCSLRDYLEKYFGQDWALKYEECFQQRNLPEAG